MRANRTSHHRRTQGGAQRRSVRACTVLCTAILLGALALTAVAPARPIAKPRWVTGVRLTEYWPVPESWFNGRRVATPGLGGKHRVDWLYSSRGLSMEGDGTDLSGRRVHIENVGASGWIDKNARRSGIGTAVWRAENYWRNSSGAFTYPLDGGGWARGTGRTFVPNKGITFGSGPSRPLSYYRSIAVDPSLIPMRSRVYIPAYKAAPAGGWMCAVDTGGAIIGRHIDVFRPAPRTEATGGYSLDNEPVYVVPPGRSLPKGAPRMTVDPCVSGR